MQSASPHAIAATPPITTPTAASRNVFAKICRRTIAALAPSAMRIPISCVCRVTEYEITP